eukprot:1675495-Rhodomonas_salina.1
MPPEKFVCRAAGPGQRPDSMGTSALVTKVSYQRKFVPGRQHSGTIYYCPYCDLGRYLKSLDLQYPITPGCRLTSYCTLL